MEYCGAHFRKAVSSDIPAVARAMYAKLGYIETDIVPTVFNGIKGVDLVLMEKKL